MKVPTTYFLNATEKKKKKKEKKKEEEEEDRNRDENFGGKTNP